MPQKRGAKLCSTSQVSGVDPIFFKRGGGGLGGEAVGSGSVVLNKFMYMLWPCARGVKRPVTKVPKIGKIVFFGARAKLKDLNVFAAFRKNCVFLRHLCFQVSKIPGVRITALLIRTEEHIFTTYNEPFVPSMRKNCISEF